MSVAIPKCAVVFGSVTPPQGDVVELRVHLGCTKEVNSFEALLQNWNKKYSPGGTYPISVGMDGSIYVGRGTNVPQLITCRVEQVRFESTPAENYIRVSGRCWGERLFRKAVTKAYSNQKGEAIVRDLVDYYVGLDHCRENSALTQDAPSGQAIVYVADTSIFSPGVLVKVQDNNAWEYNEVDMILVGSHLIMHNNLVHTYAVAANGKVWVDLVEKTDTTYTQLEYEKTPVFDVLKYVAESADKAGVVGYDFRIAPDAEFGFFPQNTKTSPVSLSGLIEASEYRKDISRVRNKITVYGLADRSVPSDKDAWTESLTPADGSWSGATGNTLSLDGGSKAKGSYSIKNVRGSVDYAISTFTLNSGKEVNANLYPEFGVFIAADTAYPIKALVYDTSNRVASYGNNMDIGLQTEANKWTFFKRSVGKDYADQWTVDANFDWTLIKKVEFQYFGYGAGGTILWIDGLYFGGCRYSALREDTTSENNYGTRELSETDEELVTDNECDLRAKALLAYLKDPAESVTLTSAVIDYGTTPILAGDTVYVTLPNENVDSYFRVETVEYRVDAKNQTLEITLELGKVPPQLADYLYGVRTKSITVEKLARTKRGKKGLA